MPAERRAPGKPICLAASDPRGRGRPVLLVHGFAHNRSVWTGVAADLAPGLRPIAVDLRGHGESPWSPEGHYEVRDHALDLAATLDDLGIERSLVVGHSLGGLAATFLAAAAPERVEGLVLVDTGPSLSLGGMLHIAADVGDTLRSYGTRAAFRERLAMTHPLADPDGIDRMTEAGLVRRRDGRFEPKLDPGILSGPGTDADLGALERDLWDALAQLRCPTLVVRGSLSAMLSESVAEEMVRLLADARLETIAGVGHGVMLDDGPALVRCLQGFIDGLRADGGAGRGGPATRAASRGGP